MSKRDRDRESKRGGERVRDLERSIKKGKERERDRETDSERERERERGRGRGR